MSTMTSWTEKEKKDFFEDLDTESKKGYQHIIKNGVSESGYEKIQAAIHERRKRDRECYLAYCSRYSRKRY